MGSLISWVFILTTLGNNFYMQVSAIIVETPILFNIIKSMHDTVTKNGVYTYVFQIND